MSRLGTGPVPARIMIVGECFTEAEEYKGEAFLGMGGENLNRMLHEVGIMRSECYTTNLCNSRPPGSSISSWIAEKKKDISLNHVLWKGKYVMPQVVSGYERLLREIELVRPNVIIACGNAPVWALTGAWGVMKWHGSQLSIDGDSAKTKVIPSYHPVQIQWAYDLRAIMVNDLRRAAREAATPHYTNLPAWNFLIRPSFTEAQAALQTMLDLLSAGPTWITFDLETRAGHIACAGLSWTLNDAVCLPLMDAHEWEGYWTLEEEAALVHGIYLVLTHPNALVRGQNLLYDAQYTYRHWHFVPRVAQDTMISHHTLWAGLPKRLDFQASMYCDHYIYWKDDGKTWTKDVGEDQLWSYNCVDCVRTDEVGQKELAAIEQMGLQEVEAFQQVLFWPVLKAMQLGVRIDKKGRNAFAMELQREMEKREAFFADVLGHPLNPNSSPQMAKLFYNDLGIPPIMSRAKKGAPAHITCDDEALTKIMKKEPLTAPIIRAIQEYRSLGVFLSTFVLAPLDTDDRMRCSYNICGTETYRFNSSKNAFGSGTNLQNVPKGSEDGEGLSLPNVRKLFIPDEGFTFFDMDLDRADMQVVVWESGDAQLKEALRKGVDMHILNAITLAGHDLPDMDWLVEGHPEYDRIRSRYKRERQLAKAFIHGTNYGGGPRTMAIAAGVTVAQAERFQKIYFGAYPGIKEWHNRTERQIKTKHYVQNAFGYRRYYFERTDGLLPEALAWIPQSTVGNVINRAWVNIHRNLSEVKVLLQVHDSLAGEFPTHLKDFCLRRMKEESQIVVPYPDPLIIPVGIKTSEKSWGDC
jgi:DNA polymerase I-like protein with 3'-5' exonuclease and polymerase domains/uracil-DNA glycosylase